MRKFGICYELAKLRNIIELTIPIEFSSHDELHKEIMVLQFKSGSKIYRQIAQMISRSEERKENLDIKAIINLQPIQNKIKHLKEKLFRQKYLEDYV